MCGDYKIKMSRHEINFLKRDFGLQSTTHIYTIVNLEGKVIARFNSLFFKIIEDDKFIIIKVI